MDAVLGVRTMCLAWQHEQVLTMRLAWRARLSKCSYHVPGMATALSGCA